METSLKHFSSRLKYSSQFAWLNLPWEQVWKTLTATSDIQKFSFANSASIQLFQCNNFKRIVHFHRWYIWKIIFFSQIIRKRMILIYRWFLLFFWILNSPEKLWHQWPPLSWEDLLTNNKRFWWLSKMTKVNLFLQRCFASLYTFSTPVGGSILFSIKQFCQSSTHRQDHHSNEAPSGLLWVRGRQTEEKLGLRWGRMLEFSPAGKT